MFTVSGNAVAVNARLRLTPVLYGNSTVSLVAYTDANGNYSFTNVPSAVFQLTADLNECITAPYNSGYKYPTSEVVSMDAAGDDQTGINLTPKKLNASS